MGTFVNTELYDPSGAIDQIVADGDVVVLFDAFSSDFATIQTSEIFTYSPVITKSALGGGFQADVAAASNQTEPTNSGDTNHWAILDTVNSKVLAVGEGTGVTITAGAPFNVPAFSYDMPSAIVTP